MTIEEYKTLQQKRISSLKVGNNDINANRITRIFARGDEYVIYEAESKDLVESLKVYIDNQTELDESGIIDRYNSIRMKFVEIKGLLYKAIDKLTVKTIVAQILVHGLTENPDAANKQFDNLKAEINKDYKDQFANRLRLLFSSLTLTIILIVFAMLTYFNKWFYDYVHIKNLIFVCAAGSIGGFFSLSSGLKKIVCEKDVSKLLYLVYGCQRVIIAILASTIIYFAIKSDIIFGNCNSMKNPVVGYVLFAFLAGFSETLVPSLMTKLEKE